MLQDTESRNRNYRQPEKTLRDILDGHRSWNRRQRIDVRNLLDARRFGSRNESMANDILAYLGSAEMLAKVDCPGSGEGKKHRHAQDTRDRAQKGGDRPSAGFQ